MNLVFWFSLWKWFLTFVSFFLSIEKANQRAYAEKDAIKIWVVEHIFGWNYFDFTINTTHTTLTVSNEEKEETVREEGEEEERNI